jgi:hypothetical protein
VLGNDAAGETLRADGHYGKKNGCAEEERSCNSDHLFKVEELKRVVQTV